MTVEKSRQLQEWAQLNEEKRLIAIRKEEMKAELEKEKVKIGSGRLFGQQWHYMFTTFEFYRLLKSVIFPELLTPYYVFLAEI